MAQCNLTKSEVRKIILDELFLFVFNNNDKMFMRISDDTVITLPNKKIKNNTQGYAILKTRAKYINKITKGKVLSLITQDSPYDPIKITMKVTDQAIEDKFKELENKIEEIDDSPISDSLMYKYQNHKTKLFIQLVENLSDIEIAEKVYNRIINGNTKNWFSGSKVISPEGEPLIVYKRFEKDGLPYYSANSKDKLNPVILKITNPKNPNEEIGFNEQPGDGFIDDEFFVPYDPSQIKGVIHFAEVDTSLNVLLANRTGYNYNTEEEPETWVIKRNEETVIVESFQGKVTPVNNNKSFDINLYKNIGDAAEESGMFFTSGKNTKDSTWQHLEQKGKARYESDLDEYFYIAKPSMKMLPMFEESKLNNFFSLAGNSTTQSTRAGEITKIKVLKFLKDIGFTNIEIVKNLFHNGERVEGNAYVDFAVGVMKILEGREDFSLPEEAMHILVELIENSSPELYRQLEKSVVDYQLYRDLLNDEEYKNSKHYKTEDGKPNYKKLKKEAIAKLLAEHLITTSENVEAKTQKTKNLWVILKDWILNFFSDYKNPFEKIINDINTEDDISSIFGTFDQIEGKGDIFFSKGTSNFSIDSEEIFNNIKTLAKKEGVTKVADTYYKNGEKWNYSKDEIQTLSLNELQSLTGSKSQNKEYLERVFFKSQKNKRVSDLVQLFYQQLFGDKPMEESLKAWAKQASLDGKIIHEMIEKTFNAYVDPSTGFIKSVPNVIDFSEYPDKVQKEIYKKINEYVQDFISTFPEGSRFITEQVIFDKDRNLLGTVDLIVISKEGVVDIFDWKTALFKTPEDVKDYKKEAFDLQISEYKRILRDQYGVEKFGKLRAISIERKYSKLNKTLMIDVALGSPVNLKGISAKNLRPIISTQESTGNPVKDSLIQGLSASYDIYVKQLKAGKDVRLILEEITNSIYQLRVSDDIENFKQYLEDLTSKMIYLRKEIKKVKGPSEHQINEFLIDIRMYDEMYIAISDAIKLLEPSSEVEGSKKILLSQVFSNTTVAHHNLLTTRNEMINESAEQEGIYTLLKPEVIVKGITKWVRSMGNQDFATARYMYELTKKAYNDAEIEVDENLKELERLHDLFKGLYKKKGWSQKEAFSKLINFNRGSLHSKISSSFFEKRKELLEESDPKKILKFVVENYNTKEYMNWYREEYAKNVKWFKENPIDPLDPERNAKIVYNKMQEFQKKYDIFNYPLTAYNKYNKKLWRDFFYSDKWKSDEYLEIEKTPELFEIYKFFIKKNEELLDVGAIEEWQLYTFIPNIRKDITDIFSFQNDKSILSKLKSSTVISLRNFKQSLVASDYENNFDGARSPSGEKLNKRFIPYISDISEDQKSFDIFKVYGLMSKEIAKEKYLQKNDEILRALLHIEKTKINFETDKYGNIVYEKGRPLVNKGTKGANSELLETYLRYIVHGESLQIDSDVSLTFGLRKAWNNSKLGKLYKFQKAEKENYNPSSISGIKLIMAMNNFNQRRILGLNFGSAMSNLFGGTFSANRLYKKYVSNSDLNKAWGDITSFAFYSSEDMKKKAALVDFFLPLLNNREQFKASQLSVNSAAKILSQDWVMSPQRRTDEIVNLNIFFAVLANTGIINGKIVNLRELAIKETDYFNRFKLSDSERVKVEEQMEETLKELKEKYSLKDKATFVKNDKGEYIISLPGIDRNSKDVEIFREIVKTMTKDAMGSVDEFDISKLRTSLLGRLFLTFKNWIPRAADVRFGEFHYSQSHHAYEWGRFRMLYRSLANNYSKSALRLIPFVGGRLSKKDLIEKALVIYKEKERIARDLGTYHPDQFISEGEFVEMYINGVNQTFTEMRVGILFMVILFSALFAPDDDDDSETKSVKARIKRQLDKMQDEATFFYNPMSTIGILNQSAPVMGLIRDSYNLFSHLGKNTFGLALNELGYEEEGEEMMKNAKPLKYTFKILPVLKEIQAYIPMFDSEIAKDWGIRIQNRSGF